MTKFQATIISLMLGSSLALVGAQAQTNPTQQGNGATTQPNSPSSSSQPQKSKQRVPHASGAAQQGSQPKPASFKTKPQGTDMNGKPGMQDMPETEGMYHSKETPPATQQEQPNTPPQTEPTLGREVEGMPGVEGMQHGEHKMKMEPLPPPIVPKLGMAQSTAKGQLVTLEELEQMAAKGNPTLLQAATEIRSAIGRQVQSGLWPNPTAGYIGEEIRGGSFGGGEQGFFVQQDIILGSKLGLNRKIFAQEVQQAKAESDEQRLRVSNAVEIQYYQALAAQEMVAMRKELSRISSEAAKYSRQLFNIGQQNESEVLQAEVAAQEVDLAVIAAEHTRRRAMTSLAAVIGNPTVQQATLGGSLEENLPELNEQQLLDVLLQESPAVRIAGIGVARAEAALARARRERVPDLVLRGGLEQNLEQQETTGRAVGLQGFAEVGLQVKLFDRNQGNIQAAQADLERSQAEVKRINLVLRERSTSFVENYRTAKIMADRYRTEILPRAQRAYELIYKRYGLLQASYPQVLLSENMLFQAETDYIQNLQTVWTNAIGLQGFLLTDGLEAPARPGDVDRPVREVNVPTAMDTTMQER
jgi:cobalt-zinc-cadmium efflux system outer membrane protein